MIAPRFPQRVGDYFLPACMGTCEDDLRGLHRDLLHMTDRTLWAEEQRVRRALSIAVGKPWLVVLPGVGQWQRAEDWLCDRLEAIAAETARRRSAA